jgi:hypothetical protein
MNLIYTGYNFSAGHWKIRLARFGLSPGFWLPVHLILKTGGVWSLYGINFGTERAMTVPLFQFLSPSRLMDYYCCIIVIQFGIR